MYIHIKRLASNVQGAMRNSEKLTALALNNLMMFSHISIHVAACIGSSCLFTVRKILLSKYKIFCLFTQHVGGNFNYLWLLRV